MTESEIIWEQQTIQRKHDMSPSGELTVMVDGDGDMCLSIWDDGRGVMADLEFCTPGTGGGGSPKTYQALRNLFIAMVEDQVGERNINRNGRFEIKESVKALLPITKDKL